MTSGPCVRRYRAPVRWGAWEHGCLCNCVIFLVWGIWIGVNQQDQQAIDDLFKHLYQSAAQAGPRDPEAEARIAQHIQQGPPGLLYHMAQTAVGQQAALRQLRAQLADCQQQLRKSRSQSGFVPPGWQSASQQGYGGSGPQYPPQYQQQYQQPSGWQRSGGQGFLAGAGQIALGVGGGILAAEALSDLFSGGGLFGGDRGDYDRDDDYGDREDDRGDQGDRDDYGDRGGYDDRRDDYGGQGDGNAGYDTGYDAGYDDGFDGGGFDDGGGW